MRDVASLVGREVVDRHLGTLGHITGIMRGPVQDVWEIEGPYGEVMVPAVDPIVVQVDGEGPALVDVPAGLVEGEA